VERFDQTYRRRRGRLALKMCDAKELQKRRNRLTATCQARLPTKDTNVQCGICAQITIDLSEADSFSQTASPLLKAAG